MDSSVDLFILKTFLLTDFKCYEDHECSYTYVHASMVGRVMLYVVSMFLVVYSLVQLFVGSNFSVLTTYVCILLSHLTHSNAIVSVCMYRFECCNVCSL